MDIAAIRYSVELTSENGAVYRLDRALLGLEWECRKNELAQRATIALGNHKIDGTNLAGIAKLGCRIVIRASWNGGNALVFDGFVWEWNFVNSTSKEISLTAYDPLIRLRQSRDFRYYSAGMTTQQIIGDICSYWGVPLVYSWGRSITHEKKAFRSTVGDMIVELLEEVHAQTGGDYIVGFRDGALHVMGYGTNDRIYRLEAQNVETTNDRLTLNNLVTRVKIIGVQDDEGRAPVEAVVDGDTRFGVLQEVLHRDDSKTVAAVRAEADTVLRDRGRPDEITRVAAPDIPEIRKGDRIDISAGSLQGRFFVEAVTHAATNKRMNLNVVREGRIDTSTGPAAGVPAASSSFSIGQIVYFRGGDHYYRSIDTAPRNRNPVRSGLAIVTNTAPGARQPVHVIGGVWRTHVGGNSNVYGWVNENQVEAR